MAQGKLVDSTQLDSDLTYVADAIRAKSGGSSQLAFPAGFVSEILAIPSGGGGSFETGTVTFASATKNLSVSIASKPTIFYLWATEDDLGTGNVWKKAAVFLTDMDSSGIKGYQVNRYGPSNMGVTGAESGGAISYSNGTLTMTVASYNFVTGITYHWIAK